MFARPDMTIFIPTIGRLDKQKTAEAITGKWKNRVCLIAPEAEVPVLMNKFRTVGQPTNLKGIAQVRQYLLSSTMAKKIVMVDDDLKFCRRATKDLSDTRLIPSTSEDIDAMFNWISEMLDVTAHCSISSREGNNHQTQCFVTQVGRPLRVLGYNVDLVRGLQCRFDRLPLMEDFDMTLQLLRKGKANAINWYYAQDQHGSHTEGGCSTYRTSEMQAECAYKLAYLHPGFVTVVEKETKTAWKAMGGKRTDVRIAWKKAYDSYVR